MVLPFSEASSQNKYPITKVIDGDTVTIISQAQVQKINIKFIQKHQCDSLSAITDMQLKLMHDKEFELTKIVNFKDEIIVNDSMIQSNLERDNSQLQQSLISKEKKAKHLGRWLTVSGILNAITITGIVVGTLIAK